jgi:FKBP-type peptidyl-prolyl cis-trans isomerase
MRRNPTFFVCLVVVTTTLFSCLNSETQPSISLEEQWALDTAAIGSYLKSQGIAAWKDVSGVRFIIDSLGSGFPPQASSIIRFTYKGSLLTNEIFDQGTNVSLAMQDLIPGFQLGLALMPAGTRARIYIPSGYAYGNQGVNSIPANANLAFEVKLLEVVQTDAMKQQLASDTVAIDNYLTTNSIIAIKDKSGLRYTINQLGTGGTPNLYDKVKISNTGKLMTNGTVFFSGSNAPSQSFDSRVINFIYAFQVGLQKMPVGSKATLYVPSGLGFGNQLTKGSSINIPANSNLIFDVELTEIVE